jgi:HPt (histidine-containing phosphotransfer) domain-containing protein
MSDNPIHRTLAELERQIGRPTVLKLIDTFLEHSAEQLDQLSKVTPEIAREIAHSLKSSSAALGATELSDACQALEKSPLTEPVAARIARILNLHGAAATSLKAFSRSV